MVVKKPLFTFIAVLLFIFSNAKTTSYQALEETVGKVSNSYKYIELTKRVVDNENFYVLKYQNLEYPQMKDLAYISFSANYDQLNNLYNEILKGSKMKKNDPVNYMTLGDGRMGVARLASGQVRILYTENGSSVVKWTWLSKGQLKKIFGK